MSKTTIPDPSEILVTGVIVIPGSVDNMSQCFKKGQKLRFDSILILDKQALWSHTWSVTGISTVQTAEEHKVLLFSDLDVMGLEGQPCPWKMGFAKYCLVFDI